MLNQMDHTGETTASKMNLDLPSRRDFIAASAALRGGLLLGDRVHADVDGNNGGDKALIAVTLDLEMSRNFPQWEQTHWDYEKGNLDDQTKRYASEVARRVKASGGARGMWW